MPLLCYWIAASDDKAHFHYSFSKMPGSGNLKSDIYIVSIPVPSGATLTKFMQLNYFSNALNTRIS